MWTVVFIAPDRNVAESLKEVLMKEGLLVTLRNVGTANGKQGAVEMLVPESEAEEAHEIISTAL